MDWVVDYTFAGAPSEDELMAVQELLDEHNLDGAASALPDTGQWRLSLGVQTDEPQTALYESGLLLDKVGIHGEIAAVSILTIDELERRAAAPTMPVLVGSSEIADLLGVSRQRVHQLRVHAKFPAPLVEVAMGPLWDERAIAKFAREWSRRPGRPPIEIDDAEIAHI